MTEQKNTEKAPERGHRHHHRHPHGKHPRKHHSMFVQTFLRVFESPTSKIGGIMFLIIVILCLGAPLFTPYGVNDMDITMIKAAPSMKHIFGPVKEDVYLISGNGYYLEYEGKKKFFTDFDKKLASEIAADMYAAEGQRR